MMLVRLAVTGLAAVALTLTLAARPAAACVRAGEANRLLGWSADGRYALLALVDDHGVMDHAELHPTSYQGALHVILEDEAGSIIVTRVKVGACASFGDADDGTIVERKRGRLTEKSLRALKTVKRLKITRDEVVAAAPATVPAAAFTGTRRYDVHDLELSVAGVTTRMPVPVWCVGSCMSDEHWPRWSAKVAAVHTLVSGAVLYELRLDNVCNGGTLIRVITPTPATIKVPKHRCTGSGG